MKTIVQYVLPWLGRHWLRVGVIVVFLFIINRKQIDLSIQLGSPSPNVGPALPQAPQSEPLKVKDRAEVFTEAQEPDREKSWLQRMNVLGGNDFAELSARLQNVPEERVLGFIRRFSHVAQKEQEKFGIPASVILANALLQSGSGSSAAARDGDNLFNLGCTVDWTGPTVSTTGKCYRKYDNAWTSFRDHSLYLTTGSYVALTRLAANDYHSWAAGLEKLNFNHTPQLEKQLLATIEQWQLFQFDQ